MSRTRRGPEAVISLWTYVTAGGCWEFLGTPDYKGYGRAWYAGRMWKLHRLSYQTYRGELDTALQIDHVCRNRLCANPDHLEQVTVRENLLRGDTITARNSRKTHCANGHEYTPENTSYTSNGRRCRQCWRDQKRRYGDNRLSLTAAADKLGGGA